MQQDNTKANSTERPKFLFYRSFKEAIDQLPKEERLPIYEAIAEYAFDKTEPDFEDGTPGKLIWTLVSPLLKRDFSLWENGKAGGCPAGTKKPSMIGNQNARKHSQLDETSWQETETDSQIEETKPIQNQDKTKTKPKQNHQNKTPSIDNRQLTIDKEERVRETSSLTTTPHTQAQTEENDERWQAFQKWQREEAPATIKMQRPLTRLEFHTLLQQTGGDAKPIATVFSRMDNWAELKKKRVSAYKTAASWLEKDFEYKQVQKASGRKQA